MNEVLDGLDPWVEVVGQRQVLATLELAALNPVHAYLFLAPPGSGALQAGLGFAGLLLAADRAAGGADRAVLERCVRLAIQAKHPDLIVISAQGTGLRSVEADQIVQAGLRSPVEGQRKVILVTGFEQIEDAAIGRLLKMVEEPPASTVFVFLADDVIPETVTIASRCVEVRFGPLTEVEIVTALSDEGVELERARLAASAAGGDMDRARLLSVDEELSQRAELWRSVPDSLDGSGFTATELVAALRAGMDRAQGPLVARHEQELALLEARVEQLGERGSGRSQLVAAHKRELRRLRYDELRFGFAILARFYRDRLWAGPAVGADKALEQIRTATENLVFNPNEVLLLQNLFVQLDMARS